MTKAPSPPPSFDPHEMALRGRIGAYKLHATHDPRETTATARATFLSKFEQTVDPEGKLPDAERQRRAEYERKAYFLSLALKSAKKRREGTAGKNASKKKDGAG